MSDIMAQDEKSVLARWDRNSWIQDPEEQITLLGGRLVWRISKRNRKYWKVARWMWTITSTVAAIVFVFLYFRNRILDDEPAPSEKRNLIFMVSDGMGPASLALTREYYQNITKSGFDETLYLDKHLVGSHRTRSHDEPVSDSAAGATAFACHQKTYNGGVSVDPEGRPLGSVLEAAHRAGYKTGLVVTTAIVDATPATFASHVKWRKSRDSIAEQLVGMGPLGRSLDVILGGGREYFLPNTHSDSRRSDNRDLIAEAKADGWWYVEERIQLYRPPPKLPLLALMAVDRTPYEIDRRYNQTQKFGGLREATEDALKLLHKAVQDDPRSKGFFLMVEGSQIDNTAHDNDPAAHVREVLAYDHAFETAKNFLIKNEISGNLISTSDHETGGLSAGVQLDDRYPKPYRWNPSELETVTRSAKSMGIDWLQFLRSRPNLQQRREKAEEFLLKIFPNPNARPTPQEINYIARFKPGRAREEDAQRWSFAKVVSNRALVGWATHGHSAVDVNVYAYSSKVNNKNDRADRALRGNQANTNIGAFMTRYLGVGQDQDGITRELRENPPTLGPFPKPEPLLNMEFDDEYDMDHEDREYEMYREFEDYEDDEEDEGDV